MIKFTINGNPTFGIVSIQSLKGNNKLVVNLVNAEYAIRTITALNQIGGWVTILLMKISDTTYDFLMIL